MKYSSKRIGTHQLKNFRCCSELLFEGSVLFEGRGAAVGCLLRALKMVQPTDLDNRRLHRLFDDLLVNILYHTMC